ncbi:hypothetical protein PL8927_380079 [Planktothrix serta PCC 8927]|uniref:Uncharacterized protein n=1 Tax=Planktothrix serta PCC 8927 TaxID=671068 RepID=A0A7Z9BJ29_9CYAN|nr:hypothetical protein PL8927_380079 [Planktothrix serta PCC 8927]
MLTVLAVVIPSGSGLGADPLRRLLLLKFTIARVFIDQMINFNRFHLQFTRGMIIV